MPTQVQEIEDEAPAATTPDAQSKPLIPFSVVIGAERARVQRAVDAAADAAPLWAAKMHENVFLDGAEIMIGVPQPVDPERELNATKDPIDRFRPIKMVRLQDAAAEFEWSAREQVSRRRMCESKLRIVWLEKTSKERAAQDDAEAQAQWRQRNEIFLQLPTPVAAALTVAAELPAGDMRRAFSRLAELLSQPEIGEPKNCDAEIISLAKRLAPRAH